MLPFFIFTQICYKKSKKEDVYIIDSYPIKVCNNKRISQHKLFEGLAKRGKSSMRWFFGFKLHIIINHIGEIVAFSITPGNVTDNNKNLVKSMTVGLKGKMLGDKGYISKELFKELQKKGLSLITKN